jgi:DNA-binding MarR family transcriptional regulator
VSATDTENVNPPAPVRAYTRLLRAHASTVRCLSARLLADHGLTINDYEALYLLSQAEGGRMRRVDLAYRLLLTPSGVTRLLEGLEEAGLVARASCPSDLRVTYAQLTDAGAAALERASCEHERSIAALLQEHLSDAEIAVLAEILGKLPGVAAGSDVSSTSRRFG